MQDEMLAGMDTTVVKPKSTKVKQPPIKGNYEVFKHVRNNPRTNKTTREEFVIKTFEVVLEGDPESRFVDISEDLVDVLLTATDDGSVVIQETIETENENVNGRIFPTNNVWHNWHFVLPKTRVPEKAADRKAYMAAELAK